MSIAYLNGEYQQLEKARVSVLDRGFTFGDGVYEVIPVFSGNIFRVNEHIGRLKNSLRYTYIKNPHSDSGWLEIFSELVNKNPQSNDQSIYVQVTRGVGDREHEFDSEINPTVFAMCRPLVEKDYSMGISVITHPDIRWAYCHIKAITLLPSVILKHYAREKDGSSESILLKDGMVTEGASSNVFIVENGTVKTPEKDEKLLPGITRDLVVELLNENNIKCLETPVSENQLRQADEIWITSSTMGIAPVVMLDGKPVGNGAPGITWQRTNELYQLFKQKTKSL